jgi:hypothetical protein
MAQTRAGAKAMRNALAWVVVLAGYRPTPAEELPDHQPAGQVDVAPVPAPTDPDDPALVQEARTLFRTPEEDRDALLAEANRLAKVLKLTAKERSAFKLEYLGSETADVLMCDLAALAAMVAAMQKREPKA